MQSPLIDPLGKKIEISNWQKMNGNDGIEYDGTIASAGRVWRACKQTPRVWVKTPSGTADEFLRAMHAMYGALAHCEADRLVWHVAVSKDDEACSAAAAPPCVEAVDVEFFFAALTDVEHMTEEDKYWFARALRPTNSADMEVVVGRIAAAYGIYDVVEPCCGASGGSASRSAVASSSWLLRRRAASRNTEADNQHDACHREKPTALTGSTS